MTRNYRGVKRAKFGNRQAAARDGRVFSSGKEMGRYEELLLLQRLGEISGLECQVKWELIPRQPKEGKHLRSERAVTWTSDFQYFTKDGNFVVEDAKSKATMTQQYIIRRKLMRWIHGVSIVEV